jgi:hypothetical protein
MMNLHRMAVAALVGFTGGCASTTVHRCMGEVYTGDATAEASGYIAIPDPRHIRPMIRDNRLVTPFFAHNFSATCFDTLECRVRYNNRYDPDDNGPTGTFTDELRSNLHAFRMGIANFPEPAEVKWVSKDGISHSAKIDIGSIFPSLMVLYGPDLNVNDVNLQSDPFPPDIYLVVENRSIHVYMRAHVDLRHPTDPRNELTNYREDLVLAYTEDF